MPRGKVLVSGAIKTFRSLKNVLIPSSESIIAYLFIPVLKENMKTQNPLTASSACVFVEYSHVCVCVCPQVREGSCDPGGEQGWPGERAGGVVQRRSGPRRGVGLPVHGDLGQKQNHGRWTVRWDRSADGLRRPAGQRWPLLLLLQYTIAPWASKEQSGSQVHFRGSFSREIHT